MAEILLINPLPSGKNKTGSKAFQQVSSALPLGIMYIGQYLMLHDYDVKIFDLNFKPITKEEFIEILNREKPKIIGISVLTEFYYSAIQIAQVVKEWNSNTVIVMGGAHVTFMDNEAIKTDFVDFVVRHEGEVTMLELADNIIHKKGKKITEITGITYAVDNGNGCKKIIRNEERKPSQDLDAIPFPARTLMDLDKYRYRGAMVSSRGCPGKCTFCSAGAMAGGKYRIRSAENVVAEMNYIYNDLGYHTVSIVDDTMTAIPGRLKKICNLLIKSGFKGKWSCESRVDVVTKEILVLMKEAGCFFIQFGLESADQEILDAIGKKITIQQVEDAVRTAREVQMDIKCSYMVGHHLDTDQSIMKTISFVKMLYEKYGVFAPVSINTPFPGTYLRNHANEIGVKILSNDWASYTLDNCVIETKFLNRNQIKHWHYIGAENFLESQKNLKFNTEIPDKEQYL